MPVPAIASRDRARVARIGTGAPLAAHQVGGKGASLDRLTRSGWAVPPAVCITADAFRDQLAAVARRVPLDELTAALPAPEARAGIVAAFEATPTVPALRDAIAAAVAELVHDLERLVGGGVGAGVGAAFDGRSAPAEDALASFAIRSSALDEDGAVASFAGLHETELGRTADEVEPAVRRCWASLWSIPAISYRFRRALPVDDLAMAVVVQALVPAEASAVVFTRHPVTGRDDHVLLTTIRGLGEPMVSGEATPDTIVVDRASRRSSSARRAGPACVSSSSTAGSSSATIRCRRRSCPTRPSASLSISPWRSRGLPDTRSMSRRRAPAGRGSCSSRARSPPDEAASMTDPSRDHPRRSRRPLAGHRVGRARVCEPDLGVGRHAHAPGAHAARPVLPRGARDRDERSAAEARLPDAQPAEDPERVRVFLVLHRRSGGRACRPPGAGEGPPPGGDRGRRRVVARCREARGRGAVPRARQPPEPGLGPGGPRRGMGPGVADHRTDLGHPLPGDRRCV